MLSKHLKKIKIFLTIIFLLFLLQFITAYWFGILAQQEFNKHFQYITNSPLVKIVGRSYKRGLFSSDIETKLIINNQFINNLITVLPSQSESTLSKDINANYLISYNTHVSQGIFAGLLHGQFTPVIAYTQTHLIFPEPINKLLVKFFANKNPITISNTLYLNKSGKYLFHSPKFSYDEALSGVTINWQGLDLKVNYNSDFNKFNNKLLIPGFNMNAPTKGNFIIEGIDYSSQSHFSKNNIKIGKTNLKLANLTIHFENESDVKIKFGELIKLLTGINSVDFLNEIDVINSKDISLNKVSYASISNDDGKYFSSKVQANFESLTSTKSKFGPMNFDMTLEHISAAEFSKLLDTLNNSAGINQTNDNKEKFLNNLKLYLTPILIKSPIIKLNNFKLITANGQISLDGFVTTNNFLADDVANQAKFIQKIDASIDFTVPQPIMAYFFVLQMKYLLTAGNAQMDQQSSEALTKVVNILLENQLKSWLKKGYIIRNDNMLSSQIKFESGIVTMNGHKTN